MTTFLARLMAATKVPREELRKIMGLSRAEMQTMEDAPESGLPGMNLDPFWAELSDFVSYRLSLWMAIKAELDRKLERDRKRQLLARARMRDR